MLRIAYVFCFTAFVWGCSTDSSASSPTGPQAPPIPPELVSLPRTDAGHPIVVQSAGKNGKTGFQVTYKHDRDDEVVRWAECLQEAYLCQQQADKVACLRNMKACPDDNAGFDCCAPTCLAQLRQRLDQGMEQGKAISETLVKGDCYPKFAQLRDSVRKP